MQNMFFCVCTGIRTRDNVAMSIYGRYWTLIQARCHHNLIFKSIFLKVLKLNIIDFHKMIQFLW